MTFFLFPLNYWDLIINTYIQNNSGLAKYWIQKINTYENPEKTLIARGNCVVTIIVILSSTATPEIINCAKIIFQTTMSLHTSHKYVCYCTCPFISRHSVSNDQHKGCQTLTWHCMCAHLNKMPAYQNQV